MFALEVALICSSSGYHFERKRKKRIRVNSTLSCYTLSCSYRSKEMRNCRVMHRSKKCKKRTGNSMTISDDGKRKGSGAPLNDLIMANPEVG